MTAPGFLERMAAASRERARAAAAGEPEGRLLRRAGQCPAPPRLALERFDVIAELKLRSPAVGEFGAPGFDRGAQIAAYARGGAAAVSVLTEPREFRGSLAHLEEAASVLTPLGCPVMRKDFLTDPYQVMEARCAGASGVLVIVTMLTDGEARALIDCARELEMFVLLEAFDRRDLERIADLVPEAETRPQRRADPRAERRAEPGAARAGDGGAAELGVLAGVNCRSLETLEVDFERFAALAEHLPRHLPTVAESGIDSADRIARVARLGYRLALVGSSLMQSSAPADTLADYVAAGRAARGKARQCL